VILAEAILRFFISVNLCPAEQNGIYITTASINRDKGDTVDKKG
jgi:hypothetical protein